VLCLWIWSNDLPHETVRRLLWSCVASQGIVDLTITVLAGFRCLYLLGGERLFQWYTHNWFRLVVDVSTVVLANDVKERHWPAEGSEDGSIMAINSLLHGVHLLYQLRAFQWSGQRLLPIMKSVQPIAGMLVIMLFLITSFLNAYWAMDRNVDGDIRIYEVVVFLLTGEGFLQTSDVAAMDPKRRAMSIIVTVFASFFFIAIALNVFIAVLSDCYDQEQERMVCTFLKERARICSGLFLLPSWDFLQRPPVLERNATLQSKEVEAAAAERNRQSVKLASAGLLLAIVALVSGAVVSLSTDISAWLGAVLLSVGVLLAQVQLRHLLTIGWRERYLWLCHDVKVDEDMFLAPAGSDEGVNTVETYGRLAVIKRYMYDQCRVVSVDCRTQVSTLQRGLDDCHMELGALRAEVRALTSAIARAGNGGLPPEAMPAQVLGHAMPTSASGHDTRRGTSRRCGEGKASLREDGGFNL